MNAGLFPGQGAHSPQMFDEIKHTKVFMEIHDFINNKYCIDLLSFSKEKNLFNSNLISSLSTFITSTSSYNLYKQSNELRAYCGYSIGQYTAMYHAGMLPLDIVLDLIFKRAEIMNDALKNISSGMLAVIGLSEETINELCEKISTSNNQVQISNYNCYGQYTLSGNLNAIDSIADSLEKLGAKKVLKLNVEGAWHCKLLKSASIRFRRLLDSINFLDANVPVLDNYSGNILPKDSIQIRNSLAKHLSNPVKWESCIKTMEKIGVDSFVEIGYGQVLSKFGFFINRKLSFKSFFI